MAFFKSRLYQNIKATAVTNFSILRETTSGGSA
jgi:hypothetical protein